MIKLLKKTALVLASLILLILLTGFLFVSFSPQFGGTPTEERRKLYEKTGRYSDGKFHNEEPFNLTIDCHSVKEMLKEMLSPDPNVSPKKDVPVQKIGAATITNKSDSLTRVTWFGHSAFLLEIDGKTLLLDPIFSQYAAPHALLGRKRYSNEMPIEIEQLPEIDAVLISHDHYDHLDYPSIKKLKEKTRRFYVPLGVGSHLAAWEISWDKIYETDWREEKTFDSLTLILAPAKHMSGRGLGDQFVTLWGSWVIRGQSRNIYFSGDGGYGAHFKEIGEKYGPFDLGLMECGQYNDLWPDVHMTPEQTVQAGIDVRASLIVPIHWGAFTLATHSWTDPIERVTAEAIKQNLPVSTPRIGESIIVGKPEYPRQNWWENL